MFFDHKMAIQQEIKEKRPLKKPHYPTNIPLATVAPLNIAPVVSMNIPDEINIECKLNSVLGTLNEHITKITLDKWDFFYEVLNDYFRVLLKTELTINKDETIDDETCILKLAIIASGYRSPSEIMNFYLLFIIGNTLKKNGKTDFILRCVTFTSNFRWYQLECGLGTTARQRNTNEKIMKFVDFTKRICSALIEAYKKNKYVDYVIFELFNDGYLHGFTKEEAFINLNNLESSLLSVRFDDNNQLYASKYDCMYLCFSDSNKKDFIRLTYYEKSSKVEYILGKTKNVRDVKESCLQPQESMNKNTEYTIQELEVRFEDFYKFINSDFFSDLKERRYIMSSYNQIFCKANEYFEKIREKFKQMKQQEVSDNSLITLIEEEEEKYPTTLAPKM